MSRPAVFVDRDGTLIRDRDYLADPGGVELFDGVAEGLLRLKDADLPYVIVTNQSGIARGLYTLADYEAVAARLLEILEALGVPPLSVEYCPHHPDFTGPCDCRKPATGMYRRAIERWELDPTVSYFVGDKSTDVEPAETLGGTGLLVRTGYGTEHADRVATPVQVVDDFGAAVDWIVRSVDPKNRQK